MQPIKKVSIIYSTSREIKKTLQDANAIIYDLKIKVIESHSIEKLEKLKDKKALSKSDLILVIGGFPTLTGGNPQRVFFFTNILFTLMKIFAS